MKHIILISFLLCSIGLNAQYYGLFNKPVSGSAYSSEYQAILDEIDLNGWTEPTETQKTAGDNLCGCLVDNGIWSELDWLVIARGASSSNQAYDLNWIAPTGSWNMTGLGGITWNTTDGFGTDGSARIKTGWAPDDGVNYTQNSASFGAWVDNYSTSGSPGIMGLKEGAYETYIEYDYVFSTVWDVDYEINGATPETYSPPISTTDDIFWHVWRTSSTAIYLGQNGSQVDTDNTTSSSPKTIEFYLHAVNDDGSPTDYAPSVAKMWMAFGGSGSIDFADFDTCLDTFWSEL